MEIHSRGWACSDCLMLLANGETPPEMTEAETSAFLSHLETTIGDLDVTLGGDHDYANGCRNVDADGSWLGTTDCDCETVEFSWSRCSTCGSSLGGSRHAVTFFVAAS